MNGAVHTSRDMGERWFLGILRKAEGLVQCVYEEHKSYLISMRSERRISSRSSWYC